MAINFAAANTAGLNNPGTEIITLVKDGSGNFINPPSYDKMREYLRSGEVPMLFVTTEGGETGSLYQLVEYSETENKIRFSNDATTIAFSAGASAPVVSDVGGGGGAGADAEEWVQIADHTWTAEDASQTGTLYFSYDNDINGTPLSIDAVWIIYSALTEANRTLYFKLTTVQTPINYIGVFENGLKNNQTLYTYAEMFPNPKRAITEYSNGAALNGGATTTRKLWVPTNDRDFVFPATGITLFSNGALLEGSNFKVFGRKKNV